ncbi:hypothetical protein [Pyxidicoccus sp. MSG2]|uniref:hypothetical protein n=1 Tax=Pyxidicoccus sp. MSG2 TaxID=2996790 RepID=UPI002271F7A5|nr:hypothetical protein [Pyxidicoccus sp. MSG2]MCY1015614.1 hypothetical protein [Pyxidicoccus sp. MSG2]
MHFVSKVDGLDYVVVLDGLALSSWCLPDEVVSDPDIHASSEGLLSTDGAGRLVLAWDDSHDRSHLVAVDTLEREARYARFKLKPSLLDASGEALLRVMDLGAPSMLERLTLKAEPAGSRPLPFPEEEPVLLSTEWNAPRWSRPRHAGRGGLVATLGGDGHALLTDFRDFDAPRVVASARLWVPPTWDVWLTPFEDALGIVAHDVVHGTATVWRVSGRDVFERKGLPALTMPTFATKDVLLTQVSADALQRVSLHEGTSRTLRLPATGRETGLAAHGPGTPIASGDVTAFLPWHGESLFLFDAETDEPSEVSRLLSEDSRELRRYVLEQVRLANEAARSTGTRFELKALDLTPKHHHYAVSLSAHGGDGSLWARTVAGALLGLHSELLGKEFGQWRSGAMSSPHIPEQRCPTTSADEVASILGRMDHHGFRLSGLTTIINELYERLLMSRWSVEAARPPLTDDAARMLLQVFLTGLASPSPVSLTQQVERWRQAPMSIPELAAQVPRLHPSHARPGSKLLVALARLAAVHLQARAGPLLDALAKDAHPDHLTSAFHDLREVHTWWAGKHPASGR